MVEENYVEIGSKDGTRIKEVRLTKWDLDFVNRNYGRLTKEGCLHKIWLWAQSGNRHNLLKYLYMWKKGKFEPSGKTKDGRIILARPVHVTSTGIKQPSIIAYGKANQPETCDFGLERLTKFANSRLSELRFLVNKGD